MTREQINSLKQLGEEELLRTIYYHGNPGGSMKIMSVVEGKSKISEAEKKKDQDKLKRLSIIDCV